MKSWQVILINACATFVVVFVAVGLFSPKAPPDRTEQFTNALESKMKSIQEKLSFIEETLRKKGRHGTISAATTRSPGSSATAEPIEKLVLTCINCRYKL